ncbi:MAG: hypothetical protein JXO22_02275 [Phycisphaerae bacterium]|nr:hypothetical protein [Phycisphaerae bacterium]
MITASQEPPVEPPEEPGSDAAEGQSENLVIGVRYGAMNWVGEFTYQPGTLFALGDKVVIQSERGIEIGEPLGLTQPRERNQVSREQIARYVQASGPEFYRPRAGRILRVATPEDIDEQRRLNANVHEDVRACVSLAREHALRMRVVTAEHLLGGERIVFYFCSEGRVDFRQLVKELAHRHQTRIEMRQVGARDEARLVADWEVCGRECCCKNFLKKLRPVSMKMAKIQKSTLDPSKVSGRCGRLRCCLRYEHEGYEELQRKLPRRNALVETPDGPGTVIDTQILTQLALVRSEDGRETAYSIDDLRPPGTRPPPPVRVPIEEPEPRQTATPTYKPERVADANEATEAAEDGPRSRRRRRPGRRPGRPNGKKCSGESRPRADEAPKDGPREADNASNERRGQPSNNKRRGRRRRRKPGREGGSGSGDQSDAGASPGQPQ